MANSLPQPSRWRFVHLNNPTLAIHEIRAEKTPETEAPGPSCYQFRRELIAPAPEGVRVYAAEAWSIASVAAILVAAAVPPTDKPYANGPAPAAIPASTAPTPSAIPGTTPSAIPTSATPTPAVA